LAIFPAAKGPNGAIRRCSADSVLTLPPAGLRRILLAPCLAPFGPFLATNKSLKGGSRCSSRLHSTHLLCTMLRWLRLSRYPDWRSSNFTRCHAILWTSFWAGCAWWSRKGLKRLAEFRAIKTSRCAESTPANAPCACPERIAPSIELMTTDRWNWSSWMR